EQRSGTPCRLGGRRVREKRAHLGSGVGAPTHRSAARGLAGAAARQEELRRRPVPLSRPSTEHTGTASVRTGAVLAYMGSHQAICVSIHVCVTYWTSPRAGPTERPDRPERHAHRRAAGTPV